MSGTPLVWPRPEHRSGTTWEGCFRVAWRESGTEDRKDLTDAMARMVWSDALGTVIATWEIGTGLIVPDPADGWLYVVGPNGEVIDGDALTMRGGVLTGDAGTIRGELVVTFADGTVSEPLECPMVISVGAAL